MKYEKAYVDVAVNFSKEGAMRPLWVNWENGRRFFIDRVKYIGRATAKVGSVLPVRYTCMVAGKEKYLYFEPDGMRWFVEIPVHREEGFSSSDKESSDIQS